MAEVIKLNPDVLTKNELFKKAADLKKILIMGYHDDDSLFFGMYDMVSEEVVYLNEYCKYFVFNHGDEI